MLGVLAALLAGVLILFGFGQALGARGKHQRAADLAAVSGAQTMRREYGRLFEPAFLENGVPNPRRLSNAAYLALARAAALRGARRNGVPASGVDVSFPGGGFAPTRIAVAVRGRAALRLSQGRRDTIEVGARAVAEIASEAGAAMPGVASGGGYSGPLAYRQGKPMRRFPQHGIPLVERATVRRLRRQRENGAARGTNAWTSECRAASQRPYPEHRAPPSLRARGVDPC
jgi:hypothetical protein